MPLQGRPGQGAIDGGGATVGRASPGLREPGRDREVHPGAGRDVLRAGQGSRRRREAPRATAPTAGGVGEADRPDQRRGAAKLAGDEAAMMESPREPVFTIASRGPTLCAMEAPMVGSWSVEVKAVRPFTIHGDLYYELHVLRLDDPASPQVLALRVPQHAISAEPKAADRLTATFLMGQVTTATPI